MKEIHQNNVGNQEHKADFEHDEIFCTFLHSFPSDKCSLICSSSSADNEEFHLNSRFLSSFDRVLNLFCRMTIAEAATQAGNSALLAKFTSDSVDSFSAFKTEQILIFSSSLMNL